MARYDLGLSDGDFWRLTPRLLSALTQRKREADFRADLRAGIVACTVARALGGGDAEPTDFVPGYLKPAAAFEDIVQSIARAHFRMTGEKVDA